MDETTDLDRMLGVENKQYAASLRVELKPVVDPDKLEEVFVITNAAQEDLSARVAGAEAPAAPAPSEGVQPQ